MRDFLFGGGDPAPEEALDPDTGSPVPDIGSPSLLGSVVGSLGVLLALVGLAAGSLLVARRVQGMRANSAAQDGSSDEVGKRATSAGAGAVEAFSEGRAATKAAAAAGGGGGEGVQAEKTASDPTTQATTDEGTSDPVLVGWVPGKQRIRLLVADDQPDQRSDLREMLESQPDFEVVAEATSGAEAVELTDELRPRVVLMDLSIPEVDGATATAQIKGEHRASTYVLVTSTTQEEEEEGEADDISRAIEAGASGYLLLKDTSREELFRAVRLAAQGEPLAPDVVDGA